MMNIKYLTILPYRFKNRRYNNIFSILESSTTPNGSLMYKLHLTTPTGVKLFENTQAFPRAYSVSRIISISQLGEKQKDMTKTIYYLSNPQNSFNLREEAFYAGPIPPVLNRQFAHADIEAVNVGPNRVRARIDSNDTAFIVFSELYYRGWRAYVDGKRAKLYSVNILLCGVVTPKGAKEIELVYRPAGFKRGALVSGVALLCLIGIMALPRKNKKACYESNG
jgi:uncharacterized membrane protein YfhO